MYQKIFDARTKLAYYRYLDSEICRCGKPKHSKMWLCQSCWESVEKTPEWDKLRQMCDEHLDAFRVVEEMMGFEALR